MKPLRITFFPQIPRYSRRKAEITQCKTSHGCITFESQPYLALSFNRLETLTRAKNELTLGETSALGVNARIWFAAEWIELRAIRDDGCS
jgi:hypothetical protein